MGEGTDVTGNEETDIFPALRHFYLGDSHLHWCQKIQWGRSMAPDDSMRRDGDTNRWRDLQLGGY